MNYTEQAEKLKKLLIQKGAQDVLLSLKEVNAKQVKFSNSVVNTTQLWDTYTLFVFAAFSGKVVSMQLHSIPDDVALLEKEAEKLCKFAAVTQKDEHYKGIAQGPFSYKNIADVYDAAIAKDNVDTVDMIEQGIATAHEHGAERTAGILETSTISEQLFSSHDITAQYQKTALSFSLRAFADKEASGHSVVNTTSAKACDVSKAAVRAVQIARDALHPKPGIEGTYDVLFEPLAASSFIHAAGSAASAFAVENGTSCFTNVLHKQVADEQVCLTDNPLLEGNTGSVPFDEEGVPTQKTPIVKNGVLQTYLHNTSTAQRFSTKTTANAGLLSPEPHNTVLEKGNLNKAELFERIKKGLWITNVWYTRFQNYDTGDFSTVPRDGIFLIENGEIKQSLKHIRISENLLRMLQNIQGIGKVAEQTSRWEQEAACTTPDVLVKDVHITKSTE